MKYSINITGNLYKQLREHLYPGDGKEAVAIAFCGRHEFAQEKKILFHKVIPISYSDCKLRRADVVTWSTNILIPHLAEAAKKGWAVVKIHSHPTGFPEFSKTDDYSDRDLFDSIYGWMENDEPHGSLIMLPDGKLFGRIITPDLKFIPIDKILMVGDDLKFWFGFSGNKPTEQFNLRTAQAFGNGTTGLLKKMKIGVVGCSGTGSPIIEQLVRLGVGKIVLVDPDKVEEKNLNRILNTKLVHAKSGKYKVEALKEAITDMDLGTEVITYNQNLYDNKEIIFDLATCDIIFGCVDSVDGRHLLNQITTFYLIPYFDLGVKIIADGKGGVDQICGTIHYIQPGGSSLRTRGLYMSEELRAATMYRTNPREYSEQRKSGYIVNMAVDNPAVISINMQAASLAINEFLARIHPFRYSPNEEFAITRFSLTDSYIQHEADGTPDEYLQKFAGRGNVLPLLNMPEFG